MLMFNVNVFYFLLNYKRLIKLQLQQDKKRLKEDLERAERENNDLRQEVDLLRSRLEETEWGLCQKSGELALLKSQLKETQVSRNRKINN